jgi:hypothetical protein
MKVAICIVGNPRSFKRTFPSFKKNLLKQTPADIFIHTYNQTGQERSDVNVDGTAEEYIELYSPIRSKIEELNFNFQMLQTMEPYFKSCYEVMQLVKNYEQENNFRKQPKHPPSSQDSPPELAQNPPHKDSAQEKTAASQLGPQLL